MQDITAKQNYLYTQIIDGGYNAQAFQQFIVAQNPSKGMNLQLWTLGQLKKVAIKFKNMVDNQQSKNIQQPKLQTQQSAQSPNKKSPVFQLYNKNQQYSKVVTCIKTQCKPLSLDTVITIDTFQKRQGGIFEKTYVVYQIKTNTLNSCVMRRYSDFQWFREILEILYPGLPIPPIAKKGKMKRKQDKQLIKRMYILEKFLNKLLMIADLRSSEIVQKFLTLKEGNQIESYKGKYKKIKNIPIQKIQNFDGQIQLKIDDNTNSFINRTQKFMAVTQPQVKKVYKDFKGAATMLQNCANFLKSIGTSCQALSSCYTHYRKQNDLAITKTNLFSLLKQMTNRSAQLMQEQAKIFRKQIYSMLKYQSFYMINFNESLQKLNQMQQIYNQHKIALCKRKQKLYQQGNTSKWGASVKITTKLSKQQAFEIMLPKQTKQLFKQRQNYALFNYQTYKQIQRSMRQNDTILGKYFNQILQMQSNIGSKSIMIWADLLIGVKQMNISIGT